MSRMIFLICVAAALVGGLLLGVMIRPAVGTPTGSGESVGHRGPHAAPDLDAALGVPSFSRTA